MNSTKRNSGLTSLRINPELYEAFKRACLANGTTAAQRLREFMETSVRVMIARKA